jgi:hypothetical protein
MLSLLVLLALVVVACGGAAPTPDAAMGQEDGAEMAKDNAGDEMMDETNDKAMDETDDEMMDEGNDKAMDEADDEISTDDAGSMAADDSAAAMELPGWFRTELIDVNSGQTLTVAGLKGKVVLVETMAIWCSNCLRQQQEVKALHEALGAEDDLVTLVLDIDANEDADSLRAYTARHGFDWTYAIAPREVAREIGQLYGDQFLNPPSTPMLIIDRHGEAHPLPFGRKSAQDLQQALQPFLNDDM